MGLLQIGVSILAALLVGALTRGAVRTYLLLALSVLAVYWFQPLVPLRSFDFWLPSLSLALVVLVWFLTSPADAWLARQNVYGLLVILATVTIIDLTRYIFPDPFFTATLPPRFGIFLIFVVALAITILLITRLSHAYTWILSIVIILLIIILIILKSPLLSIQTSLFIRELTNRS
ncbi:MAG: hypothetical protein ABIU06_02895, partial [Anaerolineales bacterium]